MAGRIVHVMESVDSISRDGLARIVHIYIHVNRVLL